MGVGKKARAFLLVCLVLAGCLALCACAGDSGSAASAYDANGVAKRPAGGVTENPDEPAYVMVEDIRYSEPWAFYGNDSLRRASQLYSVEERALDEFGNCIAADKTVLDGNYTWAAVYEYADVGLGLDRLSRPAAGMPNNGAGSDMSEYGFHADLVFHFDGGRVSECVCGGYLVQFEYYPSGRVKSIKQRHANGERFGGVGVEERGYAYFDEAGYVTSTDLVGLFDFRYHLNREYTWEFDDDGVPVAYTMKRKNTTTPRDGAAERRYTLETDEHGNITAVYTDRDGYDILLRRMAYQRVDRPSYWVRLWTAGVYPW